MEAQIKRTAVKPDWDRITRYYFVLCLLVMMVHFTNTDIFCTNRIAWAETIQAFIMNRLGVPAVAGFFLVSGFLFFRDFDFGKLLKKWKARVFSLLIPYLLWNLIYSLYAFVMANSTFLNRFADDRTVTFWDLLWGILECDLYNPVFWYMKYLIIFVLLAPAVYLLLKNRYIGIAVLAGWLLFIRNYFSLPLPAVVKTMAFWAAFFLAGSYYSLHFSDRIFGIVREHPVPATILSVLLYAGAFVLSAFRAGQLVSLCYDFTLVLFLWNLCGAVRFRPVPLMRCTFFLYAVHWLFARNFNKLVCVLFGTDGIYGLCAYIVLPAAVLGFTWLLMKFFSRHLTGVWAVLNGKRAGVS